MVLASGESLGENQTRVSLDGAYRLQYQGDGNLVVVRLADDSCAWSSQTNNTSVGATIMQGDGNLVVYDGGLDRRCGTRGRGARRGVAGDRERRDGDRRARRDARVGRVAAGVRSPARRPPMPRGAPGVAARAVRRRLREKPGARSAASPLMRAGRVCGLVLWRLRDRRGRRLPALRLAQGRPALRRGTATALLLTALLLIPATALAQTTTQVVEF